MEGHGMGREGHEAHGLWCRVAAPHVWGLHTCGGQRAGVTRGAQWRAAPPVTPSAGTATANASWPGAPAASAW